MSESSTQSVPSDPADRTGGGFVGADTSFGIVSHAAVEPGWLVGRRLGDVVLEQFISMGGMGEVYRGCEVGRFSPARSVAVKAIRPDRVAEIDLERFAREIKTLGTIEHAGIARILRADVARVAGRDVPYFVMELVVDGVPIVDHVRRLGLDRRSVVGRFLDVVEAVAECHDRRIVHRDLKPANILVDADGRPRVVDFGVACRSGDVAAPPAGTPAYMSPEQLLRQPVDCRADVYALGVVLHELLVGRRPYECPPEASGEERVRIIRGSPSPRLGLEAALETIVATCLAAEPAARYASAGDLGGALRHWLEEGRPRRARPTPALPRPRRLGCERLEGKVALSGGPAAPVLPAAVAEPAAVVLAPAVARAVAPVSAGLVATVAPGGSVWLTSAGLASRLPEPLARRGRVRNPVVVRGGGEGRISAAGDDAWMLVVDAEPAAQETVLTVSFEVHDAGVVTPASAVVIVRPPPPPGAFAAYAAR